MSIPTITAVLAALQELKRTCPRCLKEQVVSTDDKLYAVPCRFCGAAMPPRKQPEIDR